jgi:4-hydroxy-tetrahydrodipicolinate synthase
MAGMMPLLYLLEQGGKFIQYVKYGTELAGLPLGDPRPPLQALSAAEKANFRGLYDQLKSLNLASLVN